MSFEKTMGFIQSEREVSADNVFDLFTCVLDDAYAQSGAQQAADFEVLDEELYIRSLSRVLTAISASYRANAGKVKGVREGLENRVAAGISSLSEIQKEMEDITRTLDKLDEDKRRADESLFKVKEQVKCREAALLGLKEEKEALLSKGLSLKDECTEVERLVKRLTEENETLGSELREAEERAKMITACWNSFRAGEQGGRILELTEFKKIPAWFDEKTESVRACISEMQGRFKELVLFSEKLTK